MTRRRAIILGVIGVGALASYLFFRTGSGNPPTSETTVGETSSQKSNQSSSKTVSSTTASSNRANSNMGVVVGWGKIGDTSQFEEALQLSSETVYNLGSSWMRNQAFIDSVKGPLAQQIISQFSNQDWLLVLGHFALDMWSTEQIGSTNWTLSMWDEYLKLVLQAYPNVHTWEIWNEVDNQNDWTGYLLLNGWSGYVQMMKDAWHIIKGTAGHSGDTIIAFGGLAGFNTADSFVKLLNQSPPNFQATKPYQDASTVWGLGGGSYCDAISIHVYSKQNASDDTSYRYLLNDNFVSFPSSVACNLTVQETIQGMVTALASLTGKDIYFSETGMPWQGGTGNTPAKQGMWMSQIFPFLAGIPNTRAILWWDLVDVSSGVNFGLWNGNESPPQPVQPANSKFSQLALGNSTAATT